MDLQQFPSFTQFLYNQIQSTEVANMQYPQITWVDLDIAAIIAAWVAAAVGIDDIPAGSLDNSLKGLIYVLNYYFGNQPNLTCAFHNQVGLFLEHADRAAKTGRISSLFPNNEGENNAADPYVSFQFCICSILTAANFMVNRHDAGQVWLGQFEELKVLLAATKGLVPRVHIGSCKHADLIQKWRN